MRTCDLVGNMIQKLLIGIFLIAVSNCDQTARYAPVLAYYDQATLPAEFELGQLISSSSYSNELKGYLAKTNKLVILTVSDLVTSGPVKQSIANSMFSKKTIYRPQVQSPLLTLDDFARENGIKVTQQKFEHFYDALLEFTDALNKLEPGTSVILTAHDAESPLSRVKRAAAADQPDKAQANVTRTYVYGKECAAFLESIKYSNDNLQTIMLMDLPVDGANSKFSCNNPNDTQILSLALLNNTGVDGRPFSQLNLEFRLTNNSRYYELAKGSIVLADGSKMTVVYMGAPYSMETPIGYSFVCTRSVFLARNVSADGKINQRVSLFINFLQMQALGVQVNGTNYTFGTINYCQGFFSSGIWMAITSSLILAIILACGVSVLLKVNTMDRFDDPKGKPLNIGQEK